MNDVARCMESLGRAGEALPLCRQACDLIERLRDQNRTSAELHQSLFDDLKRGGAFEQLQALAVQMAEPAEALHATERSRGRELVDLLEQQRLDPFAEAERRVQLPGDAATLSCVQALRSDLERATLDSDRLLHLLTELDESWASPTERTERCTKVLAESNASSTRLRQLLDERARVLGDVLPVGRVRTAPEIQVTPTYSYDVAYMEQLLDLSPAAYDSFAAAMGLSEHRVHLPVDAHFVACISALLADDCGACTQLNLRMAVEAGVDRGLLRQLLEDPARLPPVLRLVHEHATQVVRGGNADADRVARLRRALGDAAFAELAVNILGARIYPALRRAIGAEVACPPPNLDF